MLTNTNIRRLEALVATGMPGGYKVVLFFIVQYYFGISQLGEIASWLSAAQILGFFTAIGWASLILVRIPQAQTAHQQAEELNKILIMAGVTLLAIFGACMTIGYITKSINEATQICTLLIGWTLYQLPRHFLIALKAYRKTILFDTLLLIGTTVSLHLVKSTENIAIIISATMLLTGILIILENQIKYRAKFIISKYDFKGLEFGFANFLSGGVILSIIPIATKFDDANSVGIISLFLSLSSITLLIPRAISLSQLPDLARKFKTQESLDQDLSKMSREINKSNLATGTINLILALSIFAYFSRSFEDLYTAASLILLTLYSYTNNKTLIQSNILASAEDSRKILKTNIIAASIFFASVFTLYATTPDNSFLITCIMLTATTALRLQMTKHQTRATIKQRELSINSLQQSKQ